MSKQTAKTSNSQAMQNYYDGKAKHPGGRPTKYNQTILRKTKHYLAHYTEYGDKLPTVAALTDVLDINEETIYKWAKQEDKQEFTKLLQKIKKAQERILINNGLDSTYNSSITKLLLMKHGYTDKPEGVDSKGITVNVDRGRVSIQAGSETLTIEQEKDITPEK